jgi:hypothetical protein
MVMVASILLKKELKQNAVIYLVPYLFLLLIITFNHQDPAWLPAQWLQALAVSLPLAMAGAYGLQAFDLEENSRARDFLLAKPLSPGQIVGVKYLSGLLVLFPLSVLWIAALLPQSFIAPTLDNLDSFWLTLFLMIVLILYSASFLAGILLKGPVKLLAAIGIGAGAIVWVGLIWLESLTMLFYTHWDRFPGLSLTLIYLLTLIIIGLLLVITVGLVLQILKNTLSSRNNLRPIGLILTIFILLPLLLELGNSLNRPVIGAFDNLACSFFSKADWFISIEGARQPAGQLVALTDAWGRLGIAAPFQKPQVVYVSTGIATKPLQNIVWSPDGRQVVFSDNEQLKLYSPATQAITDLGAGLVAFWSRDSRRLLVGRESTKQDEAHPMSVANLRRISLMSLDLKQPDAIRPVEELYTNDLAWEWDSIGNNILAVNRAGVITVIDLNTGQTQKIALLPKQKEPVFFGKILPPDSHSSTFAFILCSFDSTQTGRPKKVYSIRWHDFDPKTKKITLAGTLTDCSYKDFIACRQDHSLLARSFDNGLYRRIRLSRQR